MLAAVVQMTSTSQVTENWNTAERLIRQAAGLGAQFVATPEATNYLGPHADKVALAEPLNGPTVSRFAALAAELNITLLLGSYNEQSDEAERCYNTAVLISPSGEIIDTYRKMHLFDVDHSDAVRFLESKTCKPGTRPTVAETSFGRVGISICYDLRFPELFRWQREQGAVMLCVPSAFTATTGAAHWHALLRARAIENQCYVLAPGQVGDHDDKGLRETYGHSVIIDPWGVVVAQCSSGPGIALAELDFERVSTIRRNMPVMSHRRLT